MDNNTRVKIEIETTDEIEDYDGKIKKEIGLEDENSILLNDYSSCKIKKEIVQSVTPKIPIVEVNVPWIDYGNEDNFEICEKVKTENQHIEHTENGHVVEKMYVPQPIFHSSEDDDFKCKEQVNIEDKFDMCKNIKTENQPKSICVYTVNSDKNVEQFVENCNVNEKVDTSEDSLYSSEHNDGKAIMENGNDKEKQKKKISKDMKGSTSEMYTCQICFYATTYKSNLTSHIKTIHNGRRINCKFCDKSLKSKYSLNEHMLRMHQQEINDKRHFIKSKIHTCKMCSYETVSTSQLKAHINSSHNEHCIKITCQFCDKTFAKKQALDNHMLKKHKQQINIEDFITNKIQKCKLCSYETINKYNLNAHMNSTHNEHRKKINCQFCDKSFTLKPALNDHLLKQHKEDIKITNKIHSCNFCTYKTIYKTNLNIHINSVHKGHRINCQFCAKSFKSKPSLDDHLLKHHKLEIKSNKDFITSKIHMCKICTYETTRKGDLNLHINAVHKEQKSKIN